jgi:hypothetical protein
MTLKSRVEKIESDYNDSLDRRLEAGLAKLPPQERAWLESLNGDEMLAFAKGELEWPQR